MYEYGKIPPVFSLALSRGSPNVPDGYLGLGGLAPVATYGPWARSKIQYVQLGPGYINGTLPYPQYRGLILLAEQCWTKADWSFLRILHHHTRCFPLRRKSDHSLRRRKLVANGKPFKRFSYPDYCKPPSSSNRHQY